MSDRAPWFKCFPSLLLGALAGMTPDEGYTYTVLLMRIYEADGPVHETARSMSRRTGLPEKKVAEAIEGLIEIGKVQRLSDGRLDSDTTHGELASRADRREAKSEAGKASAEKRSKARNKIADKNDDEKIQENQRQASTAVQQTANDIEIEKEIDIPSETSSLRDAQARLAIDGADPKPKTKKRGARLPADWWPDDDLRAYAREHLPDNASCHRETERFKNHWAAAAGANAVKLDWGAAYRNWILKASENFTRSGPTGSRDAPRRSGSDKLKDALDNIDLERLGYGR